MKKKQFAESETVARLKQPKFLPSAPSFQAVRVLMEFKLS